MNASKAPTPAAEEAFASALECVTEVLWQVPPHTSREQFEAAVWRRAALLEMTYRPVSEMAKQTRDREIGKLLRELRPVKW